MLFAFVVVACKDAPSSPPAPASAMSTPSASAPAPSAIAVEAPRLSPCALLTSPELQAQGIQTKGEGGSPVGTRSCSWTAPDAQKVTVETSDAEDLVAARGAMAKQFGRKPEPLAGVGDDAFSSSGKSGGVPLGVAGVVRGSRGLLVTVGGTPDAGTIDLEKKAVALATVAAKRL